MKAVKVNKFIWDALPAIDKEHVTAHLKHFGVLNEDEIIVGDSSIPFPSGESILKAGSNTGQHAVLALGVDWLCRAVCDSMENKCNCALYGQSTRLCVESIIKHREVYDLEVRQL